MAITKNIEVNTMAPFSYCLWDYEFAHGIINWMMSFSGYAMLMVYLIYLPLCILCYESTKPSAAQL